MGDCASASLQRWGESPSLHLLPALGADCSLNSSHSRVHSGCLAVSTCIFLVSKDADHFVTRAFVPSRLEKDLLKSLAHLQRSGHLSSHLREFVRGQRVSPPGPASSCMGDVLPAMGEVAPNSRKSESLSPPFSPPSAHGSVRLINLLGCRYLSVSLPAFPLGWCP